MAPASNDCEQPCGVRCGRVRKRARVPGGALPAPCWGRRQKVDVWATTPAKAAAAANEATAKAATPTERGSATRLKEAAAARAAAKRQVDKDNGMKFQAPQARAEAARQARETDAAKRAEQSFAAKRKAMEAQKAAEAQVDAKLKASKAEAEAKANAIQEANAQAAAQRVEDPPTPSEKPKSGTKAHDDPRLS